MRTLYRRYGLIFLLVVLLWPARTAAGQDQPGSSLIIGTPEIEAFPSIRFSLEAYDGQGNFASDLRAADLEVVENGQAIPVSELNTAQNGLQITVALNTHPSMGSTGKSSVPYSEVQSALIDWVRQVPTPTLDDFSLATPTGLFIIRSTDPPAWEKALMEYPPELEKDQPSLVSLADALDLATDPLGRPQMKRAILFITPTLPAALLSTLPDYASRARQIGVRVYVWMVTTSTTPEAIPALQDLATQTGGQFSLLTPEAPRPDVESMLAHLRQRYEVVYNSMIKGSGTHVLSLRMKGDAQVISNERSVNLTVLPPNPIFLSPPPSLEVDRAPEQTGAAEPPQDQNEVLLKILVEFPDKHQRDLKATRLYVNDQLVAENIQPPFDQFVWRLSEISESGQMMLRVEVQDALDMSGSSLEIPVEVVVNTSESAATTGLSRNMWIAIGAASAAGLALTVVLVIGGRKNKINWRRLAAERSRAKDPITQPVPGQGSIGYQRKKGDTTKPLGAMRDAAREAAKNIKSKPRPTDAAEPSLARLVALTEDEQPIAGGAIPLSEEEMTFGSDPERAVQVLDSTTVDGLHARIYCSESGYYYLADQNSVAGTWINYAPVNGHGARLEDGDLVHIGRVAFRFEMLEPGHSRRPIEVIKPPKSPSERPN